MSDLFDYSGIPKFKVHWGESEEVEAWIELKIDETGLAYVGCDWSHQSEGYYMAGFQTFDEFFKNGPLNDIPEETEAEVREYLEIHRHKGGARLIVRHITELKNLVLWRGFFNIDKKANKIISIEEMGEVPETTFYEGAIVPGKHTISFILIFKEKGKIKESDPMWRVDGKIPISVEPELEPKKAITLVTSRDSPEDQIITRIIYDN